MSSTKRSNSREFHISDFYITPQEPIKQFLEKFLSIETLPKESLILDPCAGGSWKYDMPYPNVLNSLGYNYIKTNDERVLARASYADDYLTEFKLQGFDLIISNPPFNLALEFIQKALEDVGYGGFVVFLLRLNFFGSQSRQKFFAENMPKHCFVHSKRISFFPEDFELDGKVYKKGSTDSIEYAHFVWQKNYKQDYCKTYVI
jgi:hypothetical protein